MGADVQVSREVHLVRRPNGPLQPDDFAIVDQQVEGPVDGQVLIRNMYMSVDPSMRGRLNADTPMNQALGAGALGRVEVSRHPDFAEGTLVQHQHGFRELVLSDGRGIRRVDEDPSLPPTVYMHVLGGTGFTAYGGLLSIGALKEGEQVFVSTAAGAVGSVAAQIARIKNCHVVGSTGSDEKVAWLREEAGIDAAINYKTEGLQEALRAAMPKGIDVYFDNVGGEHLDVVLPMMNTLGRIPVCGMISAYDGHRVGVKNLPNIIYGRVTLRGFVATDFLDLLPQFREDMTAWVKSGQVKYAETIVEGIDNAAGALIGLMEGQNLGKMLVKLSD